MSIKIPEDAELHEHFFHTLPSPLDQNKKLYTFLKEINITRTEQLLLLGKKTALTFPEILIALSLEMIHNAHPSLRSKTLKIWIADDKKMPSLWRGLLQKTLCYLLEQQPYLQSPKRALEITAFLSEENLTANDFYLSWVKNLFYSSKNLALRKLSLSLFLSPPKELENVKEMTSDFIKELVKDSQENIAMSMLSRTKALTPPQTIQHMMEILHSFKTRKVNPSEEMIQNFEKWAPQAIETSIDSESILIIDFLLACASYRFFPLLSDESHQKILHYLSKGPSNELPIEKCLSFLPSPYLKVWKEKFPPLLMKTVDTLIAALSLKKTSEDLQKSSSAHDNFPH